MPETIVVFPNMNQYRDEKDFGRYLERNGYPFDLHLTDGGHQWSNWKNHSNIFMQKIWNR